MGAAAKIVYKPVGIASGMLSGVVAGVVFKQVWKRIAGEGDAPSALQSEYRWREVLLAAAIQGALYAVIRTAITRGGATGFRRLTGAWPGD